MQEPITRIAFLVPHVQPFLLSGIRSLIKNHHVNVLLVCWPAPEQYPIELEREQSFDYIVKNNNDTEIEQKLSDFRPGIIYSSGWMDKKYLAWTRAYKKKGALTIMATDAQWKGTLRQKLNCLLSPFFLKTVYSHAWVPGYFQYEYARRLGFDNTRILANLLCPDTKLFHQAYLSSVEKKSISYPKSFLYIGVLSEQKFKNLLIAFSGLTEEERNGWRLLVAGKGPLEQHPEMRKNSIVHKGFMQHDQLIHLFKEAGVFCLTSYNEAWGTVIQEAGSAGMPLLVSRQCGAHFSMLINGYNGFLCDGYSVEDIRKMMKKMIGLSGSELLTMGDRSNQMATATNSDSWAATLMSVYQSK
jgi:glycosyltransferase involved in cell wall biosynthesis